MSNHLDRKILELPKENLIEEGSMVWLWGNKEIGWRPLHGTPMSETEANSAAQVWMKEDWRGKDGEKMRVAVGHMRVEHSDLKEITE